MNWQATIAIPGHVNRENALMQRHSQKFRPNWNQATATDWLQSRKWTIKLDQLQVAMIGHSFDVLLFRT